MGKLIPLRFRPGINRELTSFSNEAGWRDCDKIRFRDGFPETIGGWTTYNDTQAVGVIRDMYSWSALSGDIYLSVGTHLKYYVVDGGAYFDITPIRETTAAGDVTFSATNGDATITVTDTGHGAILNDFVTFSGAVSLGGNITADVLNQEYQVSAIIDGNSYEVEAKDTSGATVIANASDTGNGGASVVGEYQINVGRENSTLGVGWGSDPWGDGGWGDAGTQALQTLALRTWTHDNFGEDLVFNPRNGGVYYWDSSSGTSSRAVSLSSLAGADTPPTIASHVLVSDQDRHVICFGADPFDNLGTQDPLLIRWSDQENAANWTPATTNTAGDIRLSSGSIIISVMQTKREILIWTDKTLHSMQFLGPPYTFGVQEIGTIGKVVGPNAFASVDDTVYWMEEGRFMMYDGTIREVQCTVKEYVFNNIDNDQQSKSVAGHNSRYSEVWWFYPTTSENDSYVVYNYAQNIWYYGTMPRTAWLESGLFNYPLAASPDGQIYNQEFGFDDGSVNPSVALNAYIESADQDIDDGDDYFFASRIIPDLTFRNSSAPMPQATITVKAREFPGTDFDTTDDGSVTQSASTPIEQYTNQLFIRLRGRAFAFRVESNDAGVAWRLGTPRIELRRDGRK